MSHNDTKNELRKTALYDQHKQLNAKIVSFGGWSMPVQYEGVIAEHHHVRNDCGVFDVSHMGEILVQGPEACGMLQKLTINDVSNLAIGKGQYTAMLNQKGGMIDDLILYRTEEQTYLLCVNAANIEKDFKWIQEHSNDFNARAENCSDAWSQLAIQGPQSQKAIIALLSDKDAQAVSNLRYMEITKVELSHNTAYVARTGYTGELGFEIYLSHSDARVCFKNLVENGHAKPIGLGARDTLRLEACYLLYGQDMNEDVSPIEAGINWATKTDKGEFIGRDVAISHNSKDAKRRRMTAFLLEDKGIARHGMEIFWKGQSIGAVTSGSHLPSLGQAGGMALIDKDTAKAGDSVEIDVRGKRKLAKLVTRPLYSPKVK